MTDTLILNGYFQKSGFNEGSDPSSTLLSYRTPETRTKANKESDDFKNTAVMANETLCLLPPWHSPNGSRWQRESWRAKLQMLSITRGTFFFMCLYIVVNKFQK